MKIERQLVPKKDLKGYIDFMPDFTKSEKNILRRLGYVSLPGSPHLHSSTGQWIEKVEYVDYITKHNDTKSHGTRETKRVLTYSLVEKRPAGNRCLNSVVTESTDFKLFVKKLKQMSMKENADND
jgi:hypothetical protein